MQYKIDVILGVDLQSTLILYLPHRNKRGLTMEAPKAFQTKIPHKLNEAIKIRAKELGMSRQKYIEICVIESHVELLIKNKK